MPVSLFGRRTSSLVRRCFSTFMAGGLVIASLGAEPAQAAIYTYTAASGSTNWSAGTNWSSTPVSSSTNSLVFFGSQAAGGTVISNNDTGTFTLGGLTFTGTGPGSGSTPTYSISGNPLDFAATSGTATLAVTSAGTVRPTLVISNNLVIDATQLAVTQANASNPFTLTGTISGTGQLALNYASGATGTTSLNSSNSFSGGTWIQRGTLLLGTALGNAGSNSPLGTGGTITFGNSTSSASGIRYTGGSTATDKAIVLAATTGTATITVAPTADTTLTMSGNVTAANGGAKTISYQNSGSTFLGSYSVSGLITDGTDGSSPVNVVFGGSGKGALTLSNTASTFSGGVSVQGNTTSQTYELITAKIGTAGSASPLGSGTTIKIGSGANTSTNQLTYTGPGETTNKVIDLQGTTNGATLNNLSTTGTLTLTGGVTASGAGAKILSLTGTAGSFGEIVGTIVDNSPANQTSIKKGGNSTWYLSGSNSFTGLTNVNQGTLVFGPNALTNSGTIQFSSTGILQYASGNTQDVSAKIQMVGGAGATINTNGNNVTFATAFGSSASATFYKSGLGTLTLAPGSGSNTWTNGVVVQQGVLSFSSLGALASGTIRVSSGTLQYGPGVTDDISSRFTLTAASNGAIDTNGNNVTFANPVASTGTGNGGLIKAGAGSLTLQASSTYSLGTSLLGGSLVAGNVGAFGSGPVNVSSGTLNLGGYNVANAITMYGGALSSASNYTGALAIGGTSTVGVVQLTGSIGTGATVNAGSSLGGTAVLAGTIAGAGLVGPGGSSPGILAAAAANPSAGGSFAFEFTQANPDYAQIQTSGNDVLKLTGGSPFSSSLSSGNAVNIYFSPAAVELGTLTGGFFTSTQADFASSITGATFNYYVQSNSGTFSYNGQNYQTLAQYDAAKSVTISTVAAVGGQVMQMVVIPEPSAVALLAGAGIGAVAWASRRRSS